MCKTIKNEKKKMNGYTWKAHDQQRERSSNQSVEDRNKKDLELLKIYDSVLHW